MKFNISTLSFEADNFFCIFGFPCVVEVSSSADDRYLLLKPVYDEDFSYFLNALGGEFE